MHEVRADRCRHHNREGCSNAELHANILWHIENSKDLVECRHNHGTAANAEQSRKNAAHTPATMTARASQIVSSKGTLGTFSVRLAAPHPVITRRADSARLRARVSMENCTRRLAYPFRLCLVINLNGFPRVSCPRDFCPTSIYAPLACSAPACTANARKPGRHLSRQGPPKRNTAAFNRCRQGSRDRAMLHLWQPPKLGCVTVPTYGLPAVPRNASYRRIPCRQFFSYGGSRAVDVAGI